MILIVMGPSGAGKSTVGRKLAAALGWEFIEADDFHSTANIEKMQRGEGLTERDRAPWLAAVRAGIDRATARGASAVVACSALKERHRAALRAALADVRFVYLRADAALLRERLSKRGTHFAGPALVRTQLAALEEPRDVLTLDASAPPDELVAEILRWSTRGGGTARAAGGDCPR